MDSKETKLAIQLRVGDDFVDPWGVVRQVERHWSAWDAHKGASTSPKDTDQWLVVIETFCGHFLVYKLDDKVEFRGNYFDHKGTK